LPTSSITQPFTFLMDQTVLHLGHTQRGSPHSVRNLLSFCCGVQYGQKIGRRLLGFKVTILSLCFVFTPRAASACRTGSLNQPPHMGFRCARSLDFIQPPPPHFGVLRRLGDEWLAGGDLSKPTFYHYYCTRSYLKNLLKLKELSDGRALQRRIPYVTGERLVELKILR
jgi:hypothetical protein